MAPRGLARAKAAGTKLPDPIWLPIAPIAHLPASSLHPQYYPSTMTTSRSKISEEVPVFLRKTYHMIDSCDEAIACWSEDGETFVVKDPQKFERTIIPQFFKHSKFSSFVRQLNFYSFRKIKYIDTIKINPKLEAETANFWRFRHESFRRGRPDLLLEIKRSSGKEDVKASASKKEVGDVVNTEVQSLKKRIEEMTKNIDELTAMVQQVSLKQEEHDDMSHKRKKVEPCPDMMMSTSELEEVVAPASNFTMALIPDPPLDDLPTVMSMVRETSTESNETDSEFVDTLFTAFAEDETLLDEAMQENDNRPDPELMQRLSDALMLLPRETQEMIVDKLIAAITSTEPVAALVKESPAKPVEPRQTETKDVSMPLAAATLAALLHHYTSQVSEKKPKDVKTIPVIPVHA